MKITRYAQSCVLIESGKRILIDPGKFEYNDSLLEKDWAKIDVILVTHKHGDHCHLPAIKKIIDRDKCKVYSSSEVAKTYPDVKFETVKAGDTFKIDNIMVEVTTAVHGYQPFLKGDNEVHENIGYIVDDGKKRAYATSDTIPFRNEYKCDILLLPVSGHNLVMDPFSAALFAKETGAGFVIPVHLNNPKFPIDYEKLKEEFKDLNYKVMEIGESKEF